jgi:pilus assembly protein CpaE
VAVSGSQIRLLLVEDVAQVAQYIRNLLNAQEHVKLLDVLTDGRNVLDQIRELRPDVLMVDALLQGRVNGLTLTERVRQAGFDLPLVVLTVPQKPVKIGSRMGIVKVLTMPFSGFEFMNVLQAAHAEYRSIQHESISRTIAVYAAKGGLGKSTIAFNVAVACAQQPGVRVVLVDGSLQFGDVRALLRVPDSAPSILQLPTDRISETDLSEVLWRDPSGIDILLAPSRVEMAEMVTVRDMEKALSLLRRVYNLVIIDTPTVVNDMTLSYFDGSDAILHLVTSDWTTVRNTRAMAQAFDAMGYAPSRIRYVLNRADASGGIELHVLAEHLGRQPEFRIVSDGRLVVDANNQGVPFVLADPGAIVSQDVMRIAEAIASRGAPVEARVLAGTRR